MSVGDIVLLLEFYLKNTYFSFQGQFYEQVEGVAMGSPVSPIVASLYMEYFEQKALSTAPIPLGYGAGMWMTLLSSKRKKINKTSYNTLIVLTWPYHLQYKNNKEDGVTPFLDSIEKPETDGKLSITVYRRPTHMDQYLQWDSHHHLSAKYSVISTLTHRAKTVCSNPELLQNEMEHLRKALTNCKYPKWALDRWRKDLPGHPVRLMMGLTARGTCSTQSVTNEVKIKGHIVIPYTQGLCKSIKKICGRYGIQTHFNGNSTIKNLLVFHQGQRPHGQQKWGHILVPVQWPYL